MSQTFKPLNHEQELKKHLQIFNLIAPVYAYFFHGQVKNYRKVLEEHQELLKLPESCPKARSFPPTNFPTASSPAVLDIGCGTGAFATCFAELGFKTTGVDFSETMLKAARKSSGSLVEFIQADATSGLPFPAKSFDLVISAYVLHGLTTGLRQKIMREAQRLASRQILFYDYNQQRGLVTDFVEWAEGGAYFNFIRSGEEEMRGIFSSVRRLDVDKRAAIYLCSP